VAWKNRWIKLEPLGHGGQGTVHRVLDKSQFDFTEITEILSGPLQNTVDQNRQIEQILRHRKLILELVRMDNPACQGALKELLLPEDARDPERAEERIKREIRAMSEISHPNLLRILDFDSDGRWFVSQCHPKGSLNKNPIFRADFVGALRACRPLVEGVANLHEKGLVHRDIKPENVFLDVEDKLVLGDFGLVFFTNDERTRLSATLENVGTYAWMPPWAMNMRIEALQPSFDVFSIGKLIWSLVNPNKILQFWEYNRDEFNLELLFPNTPYIHLANPLFAKCIVRNEKDCLQDAAVLLKEIDQILSVIDSGADIIRPNSLMPCKVCGKGTYQLMSDHHQSPHHFGLKPSGTRSYKIFVCDFCGNMQLFHFEKPGDVGPWKR